MPERPLRQGMRAVTAATVLCHRNGTCSVQYPSPWVVTSARGLQRTERRKDKDDILCHNSNVFNYNLFGFQTFFAVYRLGFLPMAGRIMRLAILMQRKRPCPVVLVVMRVPI